MPNSNNTLFVDATLRLKWELTKEEFASREFKQGINSQNYTVQIGTDTSEWFMTIYPKGDTDSSRNKVSMFIEMEESDKAYDVLFAFGIETETGLWPNGDLVKKLYCRRGVDYDNEDFFRKFDEDENDSWGDDLCSTEEFVKYFVQNKVTLVTTLVFQMEDSKRFVQQREVADNFVEEVSSISLLDNLSDITVICGEEQFSSYRVLLAARSKYFEALFRNDPQKKEVKIKEASSDLVKDMLDFMSDGLIPADIDAKARDLVMLADLYRVELLSKVCLNSIVNTLSPDNVLEALVTVDKLQYIAKAKQREKILKFIKKEATHIVEADNWEIFVRSYPQLVKDVVLAACSSKP